MCIYFVHMNLYGRSYIVQHRYKWLPPWVLRTEPQAIAMPLQPEYSQRVTLYLGTAVQPLMTTRITMMHCVQPSHK